MPAKANTPKKNVGGRPSDQDPRWIFHSMKQCSNSVGIPMSILQWAKTEGSPGFQRGQCRIYLDKLLPWLFDRMIKAPDGKRDESIEEIDRRLQKAKADNEELKFMEESRQLIRMDKAIEMICEPIDIIRQELQTMPATQAALTNPSDPVFAREALEEWRRGAMKSMNDKLEQIDPIRFSDEAKGDDADS